MKRQNRVSFVDSKATDTGDNTSFSTGTAEEEESIESTDNNKETEEEEIQEKMPAKKVSMSDVVGKMSSMSMNDSKSSHSIAFQLP